MLTLLRRDAYDVCNWRVSDARVESKLAIPPNDPLLGVTIDLFENGLFYGISHFFIGGR